MAKLIKIAGAKDVPPGQTAAFTVEGQRIALFNVEGRNQRTMADSHLEEL